jgi:hypothetical protein
MKTWFLPPPYSQDDVEWINNSGIDYDLQTPYDAGDSGWCDATTGYGILTNSHKIYLNTHTDEELTWLLLKYDGRVQLRYESLTDKELEKVNF